MGEQRRVFQFVLFYVILLSAEAGEDVLALSQINISFPKQES